MATPSKISRTRLKYGFIRAHSKKYPVQTMCKVLDVVHQAGTTHGCNSLSQIVHKKILVLAFDSCVLQG